MRFIVLDNDVSMWNTWENVLSNAGVSNPISYYSLSPVKALTILAHSEERFGKQIPLVIIDEDYCTDYLNIMAGVIYHNPACKIIFTYKAGSKNPFRNEEYPKGFYVMQKPIDFETAKMLTIHCGFFV